MHRIVILLLTLVAGLAQQRPAETPLEKAVVEYRNGNFEGALDILEQAIKENPEGPDFYALRGDIYSYQGRSSQAVENYTKMVELRPESGAGHYRRGMEYFRMIQLEKAIADFERVAELHPEKAPQLWQLGICYYYNGDFAKGRKLFESHQTVNKQDVENAVWHLLCAAKLEGFEKAQAQLIPIEGDRRVPMAQVHSVFAGKAKPEDVLQAVEVGNPNPEELKSRLFFAHLYLGLFEEARGHAEASLNHIRKAAIDYSQKHYMGDVARVHLALREKK